MTSHDDKPVMNVNSPSTGSATTYVEQQVATKGWPSPMNGGKKPYAKKRRNGRSKKAGSCGCQAGGKRKSKGGMGGILAKALVPFGILATLKRKQKNIGKKSRKNKSYKKSSSRRRR